MEGLFLIFKFENGRFVLKQIIKCGAAFLLALVLCLCLLPTTAFAASKQVYIWNFPLSDDTLKSSGKWGHGALNLRFGYHVAANNYTQFRCLDSWQGEVAYCIEPGVPQKNYDSLTDHDDTWWDRMTLPAGHPLTPREVQRLIGRVMSYGYHGSIGGGWWADVEATAEKMAWAYATQILIWEVVVGERDSSFRHIDVKSMGYNEALERVDSTHPLRSKILSYYNSIVTSVQTHSKRPSFCGSLPSNAGTLELSWDGSKFVGSVTDTNGMLGKYSFSCEDADLTFSKSGNVLTVSTEKPIPEAVTVVGSRNGTTHAGVVVWGDGVWGSATGIQDVVTYSASVRDPVTAYLKIKTAAIPGKVTVKKVDAEGAPLPGIRFLLESSADQVNWQEVSTAETGADGSVCWEDLTADGGTYYRVTEVQAAEGMTLLTDPLFLGTLDASEHDITITACNNAGFALPFTGGAGFTIYILFAALMLGMGVGTGVYFCKKTTMKKEN